MSSSPASAPANAVDDVKRMALRKLLNELPEQRRTVFSLFEIEGLSHAEIAGILDITEGNSKWILFSTKKQLQEQWKKQRNHDHQLQSTRRSPSRRRPVLARSRRAACAVVRGLHGEAGRLERDLRPRRATFTRRGTTTCSGRASSAPSATNGAARGRACGRSRRQFSFWPRSARPSGSRSGACTRPTSIDDILKVVRRR